MLVKTLWVDLEGNINCLKSKVEFVVDFVCVNLVKVDEGFWKDKFGKIRGKKLFLLIILFIRC